MFYSVSTKLPEIFREDSPTPRGTDKGIRDDTRISTVVISDGWQDYRKPVCSSPAFTKDFPRPHTTPVELGFGVEGSKSHHPHRRSKIICGETSTDLHLRPK